MPQTMHRRALVPDAASEQTVEIDVLRYRPEQEAEPVWQRYSVPYRDDLSVLQALQ